MNGYYPSDPIAAWRAESNIQAIGDVSDKFWEVIMIKDEATKAPLQEAYLTKLLPFFFNILTKRLHENGNKGHIVGDKMTVADFANAAFAYSYILNERCVLGKPQEEVLDKYPTVKEYYLSLGEELRDYLKNRPENIY